ncbi:molybdenum cofactor sulfurase [Arthrobacter sp. Leaf234]|uniref:MOSC domain-containing protein n=1 Tax=Arthrobacter sp. Leaf234 TaxID=1736303 RepID=UPI0006F2A4AE|nr:MOSC domain-containing protein [Arthrobacter sp. Leaf234]KQO03737.1 molybdenum cofactor sulfurase [Arthrobacter sp. Leaf234]
MTTGTLLAVCRVHGLLPTKDSTGVTAIDKRPVEGPVTVHPLGLTGDIQASRKHHGGPTKAVYAYAQDDADFWSAELGREVTPGLFGENLRVSGVDASHAVIGERWSVGDQVVLEVTMPRTPCVNFARYLGERSWVRRFAEANRVGTYLSVVTKGSISAGDTIRVTDVPDHGITAAQVYAGLSEGQAQSLLGAADSTGLKLTPQVRKAALQALRVASFA